MVYEHIPVQFHFSFWLLLQSFLIDISLFLSYELLEAHKWAPYVLQFASSSEILFFVLFYIQFQPSMLQKNFPE